MIKEVGGYKIYMDKILGSGSFGEVFEGQADSDHRRVAVKIIQKPKNTQNGSIQALQTIMLSEVKILRQMSSPNIVEFIDALYSEQNYFIIQQLCDGDLSKILKPENQLPQKQCIDMLTQICNGLFELVCQNIIHRDIKPAHIMTKGKILKIGDFAAAKIVQNQDVKNKTYVGSPLYMSIEILKGQQYTSKCDIWSLGLLFYQLLHGSTPWNEKSQFKLVKAIEKQPLKIKREGLLKTTEDFLLRCIGVYEKDRMSWDQLFLHPIFQGFFKQKVEHKKFRARAKEIMNDC